jgi:sec-independent protein translocase protein TatA
MFANIGWPGLLIILLIVVFLFGGRRIAEVAKGLGTGLRNFKQAVKEEDIETEQTDAKQSEIEEPKKTIKHKTASANSASKTATKTRTKKTSNKA